MAEATIKVTDPRDDATTPHRPLPIMDVGPFLAGERGALEALVDGWRDACKNYGFMCLVNHGFPQSLIDRMDAETRRFHALPDADKLAIKVNEHQRGYIPSRATIVTHSQYEKHTKLDSVECIVVATDYADDDPNLMAGKQFYAHNQWPADLPGFRETVESYMSTATTLCKRLLPVWAFALELEKDFFDPYFVNNYTYFRIHKYPRVPTIDSNEFGLGAHADTGFMTFLPPANEPGLQVLGTDDKWFWPIVPEGAVVLNIGQFLGRWTNDRFRATPHRVLPPKNNDRYSFACFINTSLEAEVECLPTCTGPENPPKYPRQSYWDFFQWYMQNTYTHYGKVGASEAAE